MNWNLASWWMHYKLGMPEGLQMLRMQCFPEDGEAIYFEFEGAESVPIFKSGPRKGKLNYKSATGRHVARILVADVETIQSTYEGVTGKCVTCEGRGQEWCGWSRSEGTKHRPCKRCNATGMASNETRTCAT